MTPSTLPREASPHPVTGPVGCWYSGQEHPSLLKAVGLTSWLAWIWRRYCMRRSGGLDPWAACSVTIVWETQGGWQMLVDPCVWILLICTSLLACQLYWPWISAAAHSLGPCSIFYVVL
jgi:hypothetical protein